MWLSVFLILALKTFVSGTLSPKKEIVIKAKSLGRHREHGLRYANFEAHKNSKLKLDAVSLGVYVYLIVLYDKQLSSESLKAILSVQ